MPAVGWFSTLEPDNSLNAFLSGVCCLAPFGALLMGLSFIPAQKPVDPGRMIKVE
jgi:hypothetical protein